MNEQIKAGYEKIAQALINRAVNIAKSGLMVDVDEKNLIEFLMTAADKYFNLADNGITEERYAYRLLRHNCTSDIEAIKAVRKATGQMLMESKRFICDEDSLMLSAVEVKGLSVAGIFVERD